MAQHWERSVWHWRNYAIGPWPVDPKTTDSLVCLDEVGLANWQRAPAAFAICAYAILNIGLYVLQLLYRHIEIIIVVWYNYKWTTKVVSIYHPCRLLFHIALYPRDGDSRALMHTSPLRVYFNHVSHTIKLLRRRCAENWLSKSRRSMCWTNPQQIKNNYTDYSQGGHNIPKPKFSRHCMESHRGAQTYTWCLQ